MPWRGDVETGGISLLPRLSAYLPRAARFIASEKIRLASFLSTSTTSALTLRPLHHSGTLGDVALAQVRNSGASIRAGPRPGLHRHTQIKMSFRAVSERHHSSPDNTLSLSAILVRRDLLFPFLWLIQPRKCPAGPIRSQGMAALSAKSGTLG